MRCIPAMALASPALFLVYFYTHSLRCGLEECRQLRWLCPKNHTVRALAKSQELTPHPCLHYKFCLFDAVLDLAAAGQELAYLLIAQAHMQDALDATAAHDRGHTQGHF